ncbi:sel1 repeat family protein [Achromobacter sp.]|uniref:sel1 repeat family protein n=1 Tax=Achromobacter sp. TaxID=134375 RepID=UPI0028B0C683|nr:sel1 repeat family protein [Achromobacter sp.]
MTAKRLFTWTFFFALFVVLVALFWRQLFDQTPPSLRELGGTIEGDNVHIYGESPRQDRMADRALLAAAQRGDPGAQYMQAIVMEHFDMKEALRWYEAAAAQGYELAAQRLEQLRQAPPSAQ